MSPPERNYDIYDKELLAIVEAFRQWRVYLEGPKHQVKVYTDHKNLSGFLTTKDLNRRQVRWYETLSTYNFKIHYVKGSENGRADALSRKEQYKDRESKTSATFFKQDEEGITLNQQEILAITRIPIQEARAREFIREQHELPAHGHQGVAKTIRRISRNHEIKGLNRLVREVIQGCDLCNKNKFRKHKPYGLMKSPEMPEQAWESIAWDFITGLPTSKEPGNDTRYNAILNITDRNTKYAYFIPCTTKCTAEEVAYLFQRHIVANHGVPREIISDRDKLFTSKFWTTVTAKLGIKQKMSTAFHP